MSHHFNQVQTLEVLLLELEDMLEALASTHPLYAELIAEVQGIKQSLAETKRNL